MKRKWELIKKVFSKHFSFYKKQFYYHNKDIIKDDTGKEFEKLKKEDQ